jgi:hypothetical protein
VNSKNTIVAFTYCTYWHHEFEYKLSFILIEFDDVVVVVVVVVSPDHYLTSPLRLE